MALREAQVRSALEVHSRRIEGPLKARYEALARSADLRMPALEAALAVRGESPSRAWMGVVRTIGALTGLLTSFAGRRRILSVDIDGVRRLERDYFEASSQTPPVDISCALCGFVASLEGERTRLVEEARSLFETET